MAGESVQNGKFFFLFFSPPPLSREGSTPPWRCGAGFTSKGVALRTPCVPRASPPQSQPQRSGGGEAPELRRDFFSGSLSGWSVPGSEEEDLFFRRDRGTELRFVTDGPRASLCPASPSLLR